MFMLVMFYNQYGVKSKVFLIFTVKTKSKNWLS